MMAGNMMGMDSGSGMYCPIRQQCLCHDPTIGIRAAIRPPSPNRRFTMFQYGTPMA